MDGAHLRRLRRVLSHTLRPTDQTWTYHVPGLPSVAILDNTGYIKSLHLTSTRTAQELLLTFEPAPDNRITRSDPASNFVLVSFANFRLQYPPDPTSPETTPTPARESADYIFRLLTAGVVINGTTYNFYGHSNSQLKSRSCLLFSAPKPEISRRIEALGDFSKLKTVGKKAKRIGLLFSSAEVAIDELTPDRVEDIDDIETKGGEYVFTDGCGLVAPRLAQMLARKRGVVFRGRRYTPSVFQIRYRGYKGVIMVDLGMRGEVWLKMRKSMRKFKDAADLSFAVVEYSRPYGFGFLNDELILLLHALGIPTVTFIQKQQANFTYFQNALSDPTAAFMFLTYTNNLSLAETLLLDGIAAVRAQVAALVNKEYTRLLNKRDEQRCRILIPKSRLLFGIADAWGVLREGECAVTVTAGGEEAGRPMTLSGCEVIVGRNPCLHPGDLRKLRVVYKRELEHLVDCIVFSTRGKRPAADCMSGGDLDGDKFFVSWDADIIPRTMSMPADYPGGREPIKFETITDSDRAEYFARYTNASLGRVKNLFLDWARAKGPMAPECQQLNRLFSASVDGNRIKVPRTLESPPQPPVGGEEFVLDEIHAHAKEHVDALYDAPLELPAEYLDTFRPDGLAGYDFDAVELLLARDTFALSEFEVFKLVYRWVLSNPPAHIGDFVAHFDFAMMATHEKHWVLGLLPPTLDFPALVHNGLLQSSLVSESELRPFKLHVAGMRWKRFYSSDEHRLGLLLDCLGRALSLFHKKILILRVDERLSVAIYIPQKCEPTDETVVDDRARLFAFTHSTDENSSRHRLAVPTKKNYRLYYDNVSLQLYENVRANTWVYINKSMQNDAAYRHVDGRANRRRVRQTTIEDGTNYDWRTSIALDKFSAGLQRHVGRVNRNGIIAAEIYVISNRDIRSQQLLDLWLTQIDTEETLPLFDKKAREYAIPMLPTVNWQSLPPFLRAIVRDKAFGDLSTLTLDGFQALFAFLCAHDARGDLGELFDYLLLQFTLFGTAAAQKFSVPVSQILDAMLAFVSTCAPYVAICFSRLCGRDRLPARLVDVLVGAAPVLLTALVQMVNDIEELALDPFARVLGIVRSMNLPQFAALVETIMLTVRIPELAHTLLLEHVEPAAVRILTTRPTPGRHFVKNLLGIAFEHLDTAAASTAKAKYLFHLRPTKKDGHLITDLRIDAPRDDQPRVGDHVRLIAASAPTNAPVRRKWAMAALVESGAPGTATFKCLQPPPPWFEECSWRLRNLGSFVTARTMLDAVVAFADRRRAVCGLWEVLLDIPRAWDEVEDGAEVDAESLVTAQDPYVPLAELNASQNLAVSASLSHALTCLWGPPGTGKTHTIVAILHALLRRDPSARILVAAPTHNAVDGVMQKFLGTGEAVAADIRPLRLATDVHKVADKLKPYTCDAMVGKDLNENPEARKKVLSRLEASRLVFSTCAGAGLGLLRAEAFNTIVIDEASQQTEPTSLVPLVKGATRAVLVGDHVQLRASVTQTAQTALFDISLFERLYLTHSGRGMAKVMLDTQFRMHAALCVFPSAEFYDHKLVTGVPDDARPLPESWPWGGERTVFVQCAHLERGGKSKSNAAQTAVTREIVKHLRSTPAPFTLAVLTPYTAQALSLGRAISGETISSIDAFQGREADVVVFVTVRCNVHRQLGFLKDVRRLNVALTRAKAGLVVVGDRETLTAGEDEGGSAQVWKRAVDGWSRGWCEVDAEGVLTGSDWTGQVVKPDEGSTTT